MSDTITPTITTRALRDCLTGGLLSHSPTWTVHLGTHTGVLSPASTLSQFHDAFYPEYSTASWSPLPLATRGDGTVEASCGSVSFAQPSAMKVVVDCAWVTYIAPDGTLELLESFSLPGAPVPLGPGGPAYFLNLCLSDI